MSMNLHCEQLDLWQTPTHITYMCMSFNAQGDPDGGMEGVRKRYLLWVASSTDGVWKDERELHHALAQVRDHTRDLQKVKNPKFFVM